MSQYQYYEFRTIDRTLTEEQMEDLRGHSSRAQITPNSFVNIYNYGDFRADPDALMHQYFDAFLYVSNWGTRWLMFRLPEHCLDMPMLDSCCGEDNGLSYQEVGDAIVVSFRADREDCHEWEEGEEWLPALMQIRQDLLGGDYRALYIGWLLAVQANEVGDDDREPSVPPGLRDLNSPLTTLVNFLRINIDLVSAGSELSSESPGELLSDEDIVSWVSILPEQEKNHLLARVIANHDPNLSFELRRRALREVHGGADAPAQLQRTADDLIARAEVLGHEWQRANAEKRAREKSRREQQTAIARGKHLDSLVGQEPKLWAEVTSLISTKQPRRYDEAVRTLIDLRDLYARTQGGDFQLRVEAIRQKHARKTTFTARLNKARL